MKREGKQKAVLVVDDEFGTADVVAAVLADAGWSVVVARDGQAALDQLATIEVDVVLLDLLMPVLDGAQTLAALRAQPATARLPVVVMSGLPETMVRRRCKGQQAILRKPFDLDALLEVLEQVRRKR